MSNPISDILIKKPVDSADLKKNWLLSLILAGRPHQWSKNLFVFAPLLFAGKLTDPTAIWHSLIAFTVFCILASSLYIFNDWIDLEEDRVHPEKRTRPLTSGQLPIRVALVAMAVLIISAMLLSSIVSSSFFVTAFVYFSLIVTYCLVFKRIMVIDCMTIALGFVLRVVGGAIAINVSASHWLIVCAFLLALFLAFSKRRQEMLQLTDDAANQRSVLKHYSSNYLGQVNVVLIAATIVCYALYTVAPETIARFRSDWLIYGTIFVIYGMLRYMALIEDPENGGDPSKVLIQDRPLQIALMVWFLYNAAAIYHERFMDFLMLR